MCGRICAGAGACACAFWCVCVCEGEGFYMLVRVQLLRFVCLYVYISECGRTYMCVCQCTTCQKKTDPDTWQEPLCHAKCFLPPVQNLVTLNSKP